MAILRVGSHLLLSLFFHSPTYVGVKKSESVRVGDMVAEV